MHEKEQLRRDAWEFINRGKYKACISSVPQSNGNSIEFSLSTQTWRVIKSSRLSHYTVSLRDFEMKATGLHKSLEHFIESTPPVA